VLSLKDAYIFLGLVRAYRKFILNLRIFPIPLTSLTTHSKSEFSEYMRVFSNYAAVSEVMTKIKILITVDLCLALPYKDIDIFIV
jgi:hypothetical protein